MDVTAPEQFDQRFFDVLRRGLTHEDSIVRGASIIAFSHVVWREFEPILEEMVRSDREMGSFAKTALDAARDERASQRVATLDAPDLGLQLAGALLQGGAALRVRGEAEVPGVEGSGRQARCGAADLARLFV